MRVLIIGTGWFGCEVASTLDHLDIEFDMLDESNTFFSGSSSKNQNRLHYGGFHYCRSYSTRDECRRGYDVFMEMYPTFSEQIDSFYIVASKSILDYKSYIAIFEHEGSEYEKKTVSDLRERGIDFNDSFVDGQEVLLIKERWINFEKVKEHFENRFGHNLLEYDKSLLHISEDRERIYNNDVTYDMAFDCTYGKLFPLADSIFEVCLTLIYKRCDDNDMMSPSVTIVDGEFFSLYPYKRSKSLYTLTHVKYTPMFQSMRMGEIKEFIGSIDANTIRRRRTMIENDVSDGYINFLNTHEFSSHFISIKTKFMDVGCADRSTRLNTQGNVMSLCGGKITGACEIRDVVTEFVGRNNTITVESKDQNETL